MVRPPVDQLKADAFKLAKILATYKVKLSSQQCLDVLARLRWNRPYEAVLGSLDALEASGFESMERNEQGTLAQWLQIATSFCTLLSSLDREGVNQAAWNGHKVSSAGLASDGKTYLRAVGSAANNFSSIASAFVQTPSQEGFFRGLSFEVEAAEPIVTGQLAVLRIQRLPGVQENAQPRFAGFGLRKGVSNEFLYGAEARICLTTTEQEDADFTGPYNLVPGLSLEYRVSGQQALSVFESVLRKGLVQSVWKSICAFRVNTRILLTRNNSQDSIEDEWSTDEDPDGKRLLKFCVEAASLSEEETCDWPPYLEIHAQLEGTNTEEDLNTHFVALCAHAHCIQGGGMGWTEIMENFKRADPHRYDALMRQRAVRLAK